MSNKYTVDLAGMRVVQISDDIMPVLGSGRDLLKSVPMLILDEKQAHINHGQTLKRLKERGGLSLSEMAEIINGENSNRIIPTDLAIKIVQNKIATSLTTYPLQSVPEGWVQDTVVEEGKDFLLQYEVYGTVMKGEWWPISEQLYDADKDSIKRIIAIPIVVSAAVEKFEQAIKEFGVDAAMEYFSTPDDAKEIIAKEIAESSPAGKEDEVKYLHELAAELRSLKQSIIESGLKKYSPVKDMSFHDKVVFAISTATDEGYWEKRAQAAEDVVKYWNSLGQVVRDDILHKWQSLLASPIEEAEGQEAVEFAEWSHDNKYIWHIRNRLWVAAWDGYKTFTTQQLYTLFIQSKNK